MKRIFHYSLSVILLVFFTTSISYAQTCITITQPSDLTLSTTNTNVSCFGTSTGQIVASGAGGTTAYTYSINGGTYVSSGTFPNLAMGTYTISLKDANGCTKSASVTLTEPTALTGMIAATETSCTANDNKVLANASVGFTTTTNGGTTPYTYAWSNSLGSASTATATVTATTTYNVTITDNKGCSVVPSQLETVITAPTVAITATESSCTANDQKLLAGTVATLTAGASGGTAAYTYLWSTTAATAAISPTVAATTIYTVTATDANGCTATASQTETVITAPTVAITATESSCTANDDKVLNGATVNLTAAASGGTPAYTYDWNNTLGSGATKAPTVSATTTYMVTATDANGCTATANKTITTAPALTFTATQVNVKCFGGNDGSFEMTGAGGTAPYQYSKDDAATFQPNNQFLNLPATTYKVAIKDANGCVTKCL